MDLATSVDLDEAESQHAKNVLRLQPSQAVILFDGQGGEVLARIEQVQRNRVTVTPVERLDRQREAPLSVELLVALPKGDRQKTLTSSLTQLAVSQLTPLITERSVSQPKTNAVDRLRRVVIESCKQCGRNRLMQINETCLLKDLCQAPPGASSYFAHPFTSEQNEDVIYPRGLQLNTAAPGARLRFVIGPEGGLTDGEARLLRNHGWQQLALGPRLLRVETAAIAIASLTSMLSLSGE